MRDAKRAMLDYHIYFRNGDEIEVRDENNDPDFKDALLNGKKTVYGHDGKPVVVSEYTIKQIIPFYAMACAYCHSNINLNFGETVCPDCGERTFMPAPES